MKIKSIAVLCVLTLVLAVFCGCVSDSGSNQGTSFKVEPGYWESNANPALAKVVELKQKLAIADDEFAVFYVRTDGQYEPWALWLWAVKGGDGSAAWPFTQEWKVEDGIGYMRFKKDGSSTGGTKFIDSDGKTGLIVRKDSGWDKDCPDDRFWDSGISNTCVIFQGDQDTYNVGEFKPRMTSSRLESEKSLIVLLGSLYGLDPAEGTTSGFVVREVASKKEIAIADVCNADRLRDQNYAKRIRIRLAEPLESVAAIEVYHPTFEGPVSIDISEFAWKNAEKTTPSADIKLGMTYNSKTNNGTFSVWAPSSTDAKLLLYKSSTGSVTKTVPMKFDSKTGVWSCTTSDNIDGWFYHFELTNSRGVSKALDPYARSMAAYKNTGDSGMAAVIDTTSAKALPAGGWTSDYVTLKQREDAIIYEISVRDMTIAKDSGVKNQPGTYKAFVEKLPYLKELGVTHIQLMPVLNFYFTDETNQSYENSGTASNNNYNWGYDPHNYFSPEGWFASNPSDPYARVSELKTIVNEAHKLGLGVILDVVYNHMGKTDFMEEIVPGYFFRTKNGKFTSNSGCGNDIATERAMARRLIVDSTKYWVEEYKVDGFRFDLMGLIDSETMLDAYAACEEVNPDTLFIGEGWKMYNGPDGTVGLDQAYMKKTDSIAVFNDEFRDAVKAGGYNEAGQGFITGKPVSAKLLFNNLSGLPQKNYTADDPGDSVQYIVAHDGLTLHDSVVNNAKLDESNPAQKAEIIRRIKLGNFFTLTAQGVGFMHGGQERGRTKPALNATTELTGNFVRNSYDAADNINQIVWTLDNSYQNLEKYTEGLIALRKGTSAFRLGSASVVAEKMKYLEKAIADRDFVLAYTIQNVDGYNWYVLVNAQTESVSFDLEVELAKAEVLVDAQSAGTKAITTPNGVKLAGSSVTLDGLTAAVIRVAK